MRLIALAIGIAIVFPAVAAEPEFRKDGPDAAAYGMDAGYPVGQRPIGPIPQQNLVGSQSHFDMLYRSRVVLRAEVPWSFKREGTLFPVSYNDRGVRYSLNDYLDRNAITGLLIARDDTILFERYQYARTDAHRFTSQSMAKTVTAMLIGIAVGEGKIRSIDDKAADYVPDLAGSAYGETPIRALLTMSSGVAFTERYDGKDDVATLGRSLFAPGAAVSTAKAVAQFNNRTKPPGTVWHYAGSETLTLGLVLRAATGRTVSDYLSEKIWQPIGAEADASWAVDAFGQEVTFFGLNAVLRDYARLGRLLAHGGSWNGRQVIPRQWVIDATTIRPEDAHLRPGSVTPAFGYGYQVWLLGGEPAGTFSLRGMFAQALFIDPESKLVLVQTAVQVNRVQTDAPGLPEDVVLWRALATEARRR